MGISLILGGSKPLPGWFGALMQWKLKLKWAFACVKEGVKVCQDALCTYVPSKPPMFFERGLLDLEPSCGVQKSGEEIKTFPNNHNS